MPLFLQLVLAALVLSAGLFDCRHRKIPNWLSLCGLLLGLALNAFYSGLPGLTSALLGAVAALLVYVPLYCLRGMGAGDVKLMAAVGALVGPREWLTIFLVTALVGGVLSLAVIIWKKRLAHTLFNVSVLSSELLHLRRPVHVGPELDVRSTAALRMPHALPISLGTLLYLLLQAH